MSDHDAPTRPRFRVTIDFGGVLTRPRWDAVGDEMPGALDFLRWLDANDLGRVLWTFREGVALDAALDWLAERGFPRVWWDAVNENTDDVRAKYRADPRKLWTDVFLDDRAAGFPLRIDRNGEVVPHWARIKKEILARRALGGKVFDDPVAAAPLARIRPGLSPGQLAARRDAAPTGTIAPASPVGVEASATLEDAIAEAALGPKSVTVDGQTVEAHDPKQLIEADRYLASKKAAKTGGGLRVTTLAHSGAN